MTKKREWQPGTYLRAGSCLAKRAAASSKLNTRRWAWERRYNTLEYLKRFRGELEILGSLLPNLGSGRRNQEEEFFRDSTYVGTRNRGFRWVALG